MEFFKFTTLILAILLLKLRLSYNLILIVKKKKKNSHKKNVHEEHGAMFKVIESWFWDFT